MKSANSIDTLVDENLFHFALQRASRCLVFNVKPISDEPVAVLVFGCFVVGLV